jgi:hypothetical protein
MLAHGAAAAATFRLRREREPERIRAVLDLSAATSGMLYVSLLVLLAGGILSGIAGGWFTSGRLWIWASLVLLVVIIVAMYAMASPYFRDLRHAVGLRAYQDRKDAPDPTPADPQELERLLMSGRPIGVAVVGLGGIAIITWMMVLKPF